MASSAFSGFRSILLFLVFFVASYKALAKPANNASSDPVSSLVTKQCNNVYFYTAPNHDIKTILQEIKKQLTQLQDDINILKEKKRAVKGKICILCWDLNSAYFLKHLGALLLNLNSCSIRSLVTTMNLLIFFNLLISFSRKLGLEFCIISKTFKMSYNESR